MMKRIVTLSLLLVFFVLNGNSISAKSDKSKNNRQKTERVSKRNNLDNPGTLKSEDAKINWGQIKKDMEENPDKYPQFIGMNDKQIRETIKFEKRIRKVARRNEDDIIAYYNEIDGVEFPVEQFIDDVLSGVIGLDIDISSEEENIFNLNAFDLKKLKKGKGKYDKSMERFTEETIVGESEAAISVEIEGTIEM